MLLQNPYSKFVLVLKALSVDRFSKFLQVILRPIEIYSVDADKKILYLPTNSKKISPKIKNQTNRIE